MKQYQVERLYDDKWIAVSMVCNDLETAIANKKWIEDWSADVKREMRIVERDVSDWKVLEI